MLCGGSALRCPISNATEVPRVPESHNFHDAGKLEETAKTNLACKMGVLRSDGACG